MNTSPIYALEWTNLGSDSSNDAKFSETADAEAQDSTIGAGAISSGSYVNTQNSDNSRETLTETRKSGKQRLGWIYTFSSLSNKRDKVDFYIEAALGATNAENMYVQWSTSTGGPWTTLVTITSTTEATYGPYSISDLTSTTLYIRILDTVTTDNDVSTISIDYMAFECFFNEADMTGLSFTNDGTYAYFKMELAAAPSASDFTYTVYLDKPSGGAYSADYRMVYSSGTAALQKWDGSSWQDSASITVEVGTSPDSITFKVKLSDIANPDVQQNTGVWFVNYKGANSFTTELDRAPDSGSYSISSTVIPGQWWGSLLVGIPVVAAVVYLLSVKKFRDKMLEHPLLHKLIINSERNTAEKTKNEN